MANVTTELVREEIKGARKTLERLEKSLQGGIPGEDGLPAAEEATEAFLLHLRGDLLVVANKCEGLANVLRDGAA